MLTLLRRFSRHRRGATMVEFTLVLSFLLVLTGGVIEFTLMFYHFNSATKALQMGARLSSVSSPVVDELEDMSSPTVQGAGLGDPLTTSYSIQCDGSTSQCVGCLGGSCTFNAGALNTIVFGRGTATTCGDATNVSDAGMCDIYRPIRPQNVKITYEHTGLGFVGKPGGPVPTITIELQNLNFGFILIPAFVNVTSISLPTLKMTATGEDLDTEFD